MGGGGWGALPHRPVLQWRPWRVTPSPRVTVASVESYPIAPCYSGIRGELPHHPVLQWRLWRVTPSPRVTVASVESYPIAPSTGQPTNSLSVQLPPLDKEPRCDYNGLDFRLIVDIQGGPPICITLVAALVAEKAAWCSDLSQVRG